MDGLQYEFVKGKRRGSTLLWLPSEKHLYVKKTKRPNDDVVYICYQTGLFKSNPKDHPDCKARVTINAGAKCSRNSLRHTEHTNHDIEFKDLETRNTIIENCISLNKMTISSANISARELFTREVAK